jgi:hypothetical protein
VSQQVDIISQHVEVGDFVVGVNNLAPRRFASRERVHRRRIQSYLVLDAVGRETKQVCRGWRMRNYRPVVLAELDCFR